MSISFSVKKLPIAAVTTVLLALSGAGAAQADTFAPGPLSPASELPLSPQGQQNAVRAAKSYLEMSAFSRTGLIRQLAYEGYSTEDATYAVDSITVDWNAQAARAAKGYLDMSAFSGSGLYNQLLYEGYTPVQAQYGVAAAGY